MAPEQLTGAEFDHRADLFAIGIVLWNALTGKKLFHDRIEHMTMSNVLERRIPRPSLVGLSPPSALDAAVLKALDRDPDRRYQTAAEMAAALRDVAHDAGCLAPEAQVGEWVTAAFGGELATRHRTIRQLASQPRRPDAELPTLGPLGPAPAETSAREELSIEELARAVTGARHPTAAPAPTVIDAAGRQRPTAPTRKQLAILATAAFAVVALVLGWCASRAPQHGDDIAAPERGAAPGSQPAPMPPVPRVALEVTVLDVHRIAPVVRAPPPEPAPPHVTATRTPEPARTASPPARPVIRAKKPAPSRGAESGAESPAPRPAEPRAEPAPPPAAPAPAKPEPPRQTMDSNPYLQNK